MYFAYFWALTTWHDYIYCRYIYIVYIAIDTHSINFFYICQEHVSDPCFFFLSSPSGEFQAMKHPMQFLRRMLASGGCNFPRWNLPTAGTSVVEDVQLKLPIAAHPSFGTTTFILLMEKILHQLESLK